MLAASVDLMTNMSNGRKALRMLNTLQTTHPQFQVDLHKIILLATLLVQQDRLNDAVTLLQRFAPTIKRQNVNYVKKNVWDLLQTVSDWSVRHKCNENSSRIMLDKLVDMGYSEYTKISLGPIVREFIDKGQIIAAVDEFERIASEYRETPQLATLLILIIEIINADDDDKRWQQCALNRPLANELLKRIVDAAIKIHNAETVNTHLLTAFVISGNEQQIRKILMNPAMQFNVQHLMSNLEHRVKTTGSIDALIKLAKCNRGLRHEAINEDNLFTLLVNTYSTDNNCSAAQELYAKISTDSDFKMSNALKQKFNDLFARNNVSQISR